MKVRGVIEGFYAPPWTHAERLDLIGFCDALALGADAATGRALLEPFV